MPRDDRGGAPPSATVQFAGALRVDHGGESFSTLTTFEMDQNGEVRVVEPPTPKARAFARLRDTLVTGTLTMPNPAAWRAALLTFMG